MNPILKNIIAVILGCITGSLVNLGLIQLGYIVNPLEGVDTSDMQALAEATTDMDASFFVFPFDRIKTK